MKRHSACLFGCVLLLLGIRFVRGEGTILGEARTEFALAETDDYQIPPSHLNWVPLGKVLTRSWQLAHPRVRGGVIWYRFDLEGLPRPVLSNVMLEIGYPLVVLGAWLDGRMLFDGSHGSWGRFTGERTGRLFFGRFEDGRRITLAVRDFDSRFPNHFESAVLRRVDANSATALDLRVIGPPGASTVSFSVRNRVGEAFKGALLVEIDDYFGTRLREVRLPLSASPFGFGAAVAVRQENPREYRVRACLEGPLGRSLPYLATFTEAFRFANTGSNRSVMMANSSWKYRWVRQGESFSYPLPVDAWQTNFSPPSGSPPYTPIISGADRMPAHRLWLVSRFSLDTPAPGQRVLLSMRDVMSAAEVFVDGKSVGTRFSWQLPDTLDITSALAAERNHELAYALVDYSATLSSKASKLADGVHAAAQFCAAVPSLPRQFAIGMNHLPELRVVPTIRIDQVDLECRVVPEKRFTARLEIVNDASEPNREVVVEQTIFHRGILLKTLPEIRVRLASGGRLIITNVAPWPEAREWSPQRPTLYECRSVVRSGEGVLDTHRERFGFRELSIAGTDFLLNGNRIRPYGNGYGRKAAAYLHPVRSNNYNRLERLSFVRAQELEALHQADELGYFACWENFFSPFGGQMYEMRDPLLWERMGCEWERIVRADGNHPALFAYSLGNEPPTSDPTTVSFMAALERRVEGLDSRHFVHFSRGHDLLGASRMVSPHYLYYYHALPVDLQWFKVPPSAQPPGVRARLEKEIEVVKDEYEKVARWEWQKAQKPVWDSEGLSVTDGKEWVPWLFGDEIWRCLPSDAGRYPTGVKVCMDGMRELLWRKHRELDIAAATGHIGFAAGWNGLAPVAAWVMGEDHRAFPGRFPQTLLVLNDTESEENVAWSWTLQGEDGKNLGEGRGTSRLACASRCEVPIQLPMPEVATPSYCRLEVSTRGETSGFTDKWQRRYTVFPARKEPTRRTGVKLYDPRGTMRAALKASGNTIDEISSMDADVVSALEVLLMAPGSCREDDEVLAPLLGAAVEKGLRVIVFGQERFSSRFPVRLEDGFHSSHSAGAVVAAPWHRTIAGLLPEDLRYFMDEDRSWVTVVNAPFAPLSPGVKPILLSGQTEFHGDLRYSPLLEAQHGKGAFLFCQLELTTSLSRDPAAQRLFQNIIAWGLDYRSPEIHPLWVPAHALRQEMASFLRLPLPDEAGVDPVIFIAGGKIPAGTRPLVENGATLWINGPDGQTALSLQEQFGISLRTNALYSTEAYLISRHLLLEGLSQYDLAWATIEGRRPAAGQPGKESPMDVGRVTLGVEGAVSRPLLAPAYLVEIPLGKGRLLLDHTRWREVGLKQAKRFAFTLLHNLGVRGDFSGREEEIRLRERMSRLSFTELPLSPIVNTGFRDDEVSQNAKGGWTDEGAGKGLVNFPVGKCAFGGVPFQIADPSLNDGRGLVTVQGHSWPSRSNRSPELPVRGRFEKLFILHSAAWVNLKAGEEMARLRLYYQERDSWIPGKPDPYAEISIRHRINIDDWWFIDKIEDGERPLPEARVGWRSAPPRQNTGALLVEWDNPFPEKEVVAIEVESRSTKAQYFLIGLTAANRIRSEVEVKSLSVSVAEAGMLPTGLSNSPGLQKIEWGPWRFYVTPSLRIPWFGTCKGAPLWRDLAYWQLRVRAGANFQFLAHPSGPEPWKFEDGPEPTIRRGPVKLPQCTYSQIIRLGDHSIHARLTLRLTPEGRAQLKGGVVDLSLGAELAPGFLGGAPAMAKGASHPGSLVLPTSHGMAIVRFDERYERHKDGVWYDDKGRFGVTPGKVGMERLAMGEEITIEYTLEMSESDCK
ncbi:MAG: hypothetical protein J0L75_12390 [Spirochaetes bacterium]|nr:hypothetical protein [Spirochaetota bacterium]